jgi:predicted Zn-dependent protease
VVGFYVQDMFSFTVVGCGTLFVTYAALLSRWGQSDGERPPRLPLPSLDKPGVARGRLGRRAAQAAVWAAAVLLAVECVVTPLRASLACGEGVRWRDEDPHRAITYLERAVALDPGREYNWVELGNAAEIGAEHTPGAAEQRRLLQKARQAFERAQALVPARAFNHANVGRVLAELARLGLAAPAPAFAEFDVALALDPANAYFYVDAARSAFNLGDLARCRRYCSRGVQLYPRLANLHAQRCWIAVEEGRFGEAVAFLEEALRLDWHDDSAGGPMLAAQLPAELLQRRRLDEALWAADVALRCYPDCAEALATRARALALLGRSDPRMHTKKHE